VIPIGGDHFNRAVSQALKITADDARLLRIKLCCQQPALDEHREKQEIRPALPTTAAPEAPTTAPPAEDSIDNSFALLGAGMEQTRKQAMGMEQHPVAAPVATAVAEAPAPAPAGDAQQAQAVEQACTEPLTKLVEELDLCRRYYEATFPSKPVERLVFVGGEARQRTLCQHIARGMGLAAQVGDPMVRMSRISDIGVESGIDRRQPQPTWAVAIGLSMGPANGAQLEVKG
jgi:cell division ATPase FtsA